MTAAPVPMPPKGSLARWRLLEAASTVFYAEGIHRVGVDRIVREAATTRATFYRHFPSKEDLVLAYVQRQDQLIRDRAAVAYQQLPYPADVLRAMIADCAQELESDRFRGCPFTNAAAEYPDPNGPVRQAIDAHRAWFHADVVTLLMGSGHEEPAFAAGLLVMLRDGAQVAGYLGDAKQARVSFERAAAGLLVLEVLTKRGACCGRRLARTLSAA